MNPRADSTFVRWLTNPRAFQVLLLVILAFVGIQYSLKVLKPSKLDTNTRGAINRWASQIQQEVADGVDSQAKYNYPNPPIMAVILFPIVKLAEIHPLAAALTWFFLKAAMAYWCLMTLFKQIATADLPFPSWACSLAMLISIRPLMGDLSHGNVNIFILFLIVAGLWAFCQGRDFLAGMLIALAVTCKATPALFLIYFVWKGAWRTLIGSAFGLVLFFLVVPSFFLGWDVNIRDLTSWFNGMVQPFISGAFVTSEHNNQSLPGVVYRLLTHSPSFSTYVDDIYTPTEYYNCCDIGTANAKWLLKGFMGLFALLVVWSCRNPIRSKGEEITETRRALWPEFALISLGMLLFSERTWKHHCVTLAIPNAVLCYALIRPEIGRWTKRGVIAALVISQLLFLSTSTGLLPDSTGKLAQVYGAYTLAFFSLIGGLVLIRMKPARQSAAIALSPTLAKAA